MIVRMTGLLTDVFEDRIVLEREGIAHELLVPGFAAAELAAHRGKNVTLHTLQYLEGSPGVGNMTPRLVGFLHAEDRAFFEAFTTVKGVGIRKALRALVEPTARVAREIEAADTKALTRLPGIGPRMAQQIVAELRGKLEQFARGAAGEPVAAETGMTREQRDALELLVAWGDGRGDAMRWLTRAAQLHPELKEVEAWVKAAYRVKAGA